jgi:membrane protease YdiL (CAAX protease family)
MQAADTWLTHWWQPLYALVPAVGEEVWARLFLTTLCYALLRPTTNNNPRRALVAAIVIGALAHSFAHTGIDPIGLLIGGLLYGVPTGLLYIKRDLEHAVGYHFLIDFVRYLAAWLQV